MGLGNPSWRSTALIRQMIKISRREWPTNTSRSFGRRKFPRAEALLRAKPAARNPFVLFMATRATELYISGTLERRNQIQIFPAFLSDYFPLFRVSSNSKCFFVPSGFSVSHVSLLIATPQKSRSSRLSDDPRGAQNSFGNESPAVYIPVSSDKFHLAH